MTATALIKLVAWDRLQVGKGLCENLSSAVPCWGGGSKNKQAEASHWPTDSISYIFTLGTFLTNDCTAVAWGNSTRSASPLCLLTGLSSRIPGAARCFSFRWVGDRTRNYGPCQSSGSSTQLYHTIFLPVSLPGWFSRSSRTTSVSDWRGSRLGSPNPARNCRCNLSWITLSTLWFPTWNYISFYTLTADL